MMYEGDDAGGAIMKKLYRIHSRHVLEINDNIQIDISSQLVNVTQHKRGTKSQAKPLG
jgi:hypothetical protein